MIQDDKDITAGTLLKSIAKRNGLLRNKDIHERISDHSYEMVNRSLRDDKDITYKFLNNFFKEFSDVTMEEKKEIYFLVDWAKTPDLIKDEFERLKFRIEQLEEENKKARAQKILSDMLQYGIEKGLLDLLCKNNES